MDQEPTFGKKMLELYFGDKRDRESRQKGRDQPPDMLPNDRIDFANRDNYGSIEQDAGTIDISSATNSFIKNCGAVNNVFWSFKGAKKGKVFPIVLKDGSIVEKI